MFKLEVTSFACVGFFGLKKIKKTTFCVEKGELENDALGFGVVGASHCYRD